jgi:hypothetical protein
MPFALDLAAEDQRHIEVDPGVLQRVGIAVVHPAHRGAQHPRGIEHAACVPDADRLAVLVVLELLDLQDFTHGLRDRQVAGREQHHEAVVVAFVDDHLAKGADLVQAGVGARVRQEHQSGVQFDGDAISHGREARRGRRRSEGGDAPIMRARHDGRGARPGQRKRGGFIRP